MTDLPVLDFGYAIRPPETKEIHDREVIVDRIFCLLIRQSVQRLDEPDLKISTRSYGGDGLLLLSFS